MSNTHTKQDRIQALEDKIEQTHVMEDTGQVYQWDACGVTGTSRCSICGLTRKWYSGGQRLPNHTDWTFNGEEISLGEASKLDCY